MAYGREYEPRRRRRRGRGWGPARWWGRRPRRRARGFPVRGYFTYDLDYGRQSGGPDTDYSGRAGWPTGVEEEEEARRPRGAWYGYEPPWRRGPRGLWYEERHWAAAEPSPYALRPPWRRASRRYRP